AKSACDFIGTDTVLAIRNHPNSDEPFVQRKCRIFEDSSNFRGELPLLMDALTLPLALILKENNVIAATSRAYNFAIRPTELEHEGEAVIGVSEVKDGLLESFGLFHCFDLIQGYPGPLDLSSILLPLQIIGLKVPLFSTLTEGREGGGRVMVN